MSVYFVKGKGYRYDFTLKGIRYTQAWFKTKTKAKQAESDRRKEALRPEPEIETQTDMAFLDLVNRRLDHVKAYNSERHYKDHVYMAKRWCKLWHRLMCHEITEDMIQGFVRQRVKVSPYTANKEIRFLRATFNFGKKKQWICDNPVGRVDFFPVNKRLKYIPDIEAMNKVIAYARSDKWLAARYPDAPDYIEALRDTAGRMSEINRLEWRDVDFSKRSLVLYTRKIDGGLTPREVFMTDRLFCILSRRYAEREKSKPWVFWNPRTGEPYVDRKRVMKRLCEKAGVAYFRFHPIRHSTASTMDSQNISRTVIQNILGHRNGSTTEIYLHSSKEAERRAVQTLEKATNSHTDSHTEMRQSP